MHSLRRSSFASVLLAALMAIAFSATAITSTALASTQAGAAVRHSAARAARVAGAGGGAAKATKAAKTKDTTATANFQVCKVAGNSSLDGASFPFIEGTWNGSFYTAYSLTAEPSPGTCGPTHAFTPGSVVLVEEATTPGVPVTGVTPSYSVSNGTLDGVVSSIDFAMVTVNAGTTTLTVTDTPDVVTPPGNLELCKSGADQFVKGSFNFNVSPVSPGVSPNQTVPVTQCNDISVPAGNVTISEDVSFPYALASVSAIPSDALVGSPNLNTQTAVVSVGSGQTTTVFFTNATLTAYAKICKTLARPADNVLTGQTFNFSVSTSFDGAPVPGVPGTLPVTAESYGSTTCTFITDHRGALVAFPLGTLITATEIGLPADQSIQAVGTSVNPPSLEAGGSNSSVEFYVGNLPPPNNVYNLGAGSVTQATFTNEAYGEVEVCKSSTNGSIAKGVPFNFSIAGVGNVEPPVPVGQCSQGYLLPVGTTTVTEGSTPHVTLDNVTATSGVTWSSGSNTATVTVPYDAVNIVNFDNRVNTGTLKLCVAQTSIDAGLQNASFDVGFSYVYNGNTVTVPAQPIQTGLCTSAVSNIPVLNSDLTPITIDATEGTTTIPNVILRSTTVFGGGDTIVSSPVPPDHLLSSPGGTSATVVLNSLEGVTDLTFTNGVGISG